MTSIEELHAFVLEQSLNLSTIEEELRSFNPFSVLGVSHYEIRHSNFLAWLLDPNGSHDTHDYFLKGFLNLLVGIPAAEKISLLLRDLSGTKVYREWNNIDILIVNEILGFAVVIENKVWSGKRLRQLEDYAELVARRWHKEVAENTIRINHVYLTPYAQGLSEEEEAIGFENATFMQILGLLEKVTQLKECDEQPKQFIRYYIDNVNRHIMNNENTELTRLAREIYSKYGKTIDFIVSKKPIIGTDANIKSIKEYIKSRKEYHLYTENDSIVRFLPVDLEDIFTNALFRSWPPEKVFFCIELFVEQSRICVKFCMGGINVPNDDVAVILQTKKTRYFDEMKKFKSLSKHIIQKSRAKSRYPPVATYTMLSVTDDFFTTSADFTEAFNKAFNKLENDILTPWIKEVKEKFSLIDNAN